MKRRILGYVAVMVTVICLCAAPSFAADNFKIGVGYQGLIYGDYLNGLSVRSWFGPNTAIGVEANVFYGNAKYSIEQDGTTTQDQTGKLWMVELKAMYAFLVRQNSRFYAGAKFAYGQMDYDSLNAYSSYYSHSDNSTGKIYLPGILIGAEWNFPSLPELGFNFEVGYSYLLNKNSVDCTDTSNYDTAAAAYTYTQDIDMKLHGLTVGAGIKYYF